MKQEETEQLKRELAEMTACADKLAANLRKLTGQLAQKTKASLRRGDNVQFTDSRTGGVATGYVVKIAEEFVTVQTGKVGTRWKVPASMVSKIDAVLK